MTGTDSLATTENLVSAKAVKAGDCNPLPAGSPRWDELIAIPAATRHANRHGSHDENGCAKSQPNAKGDGSIFRQLPVGSLPWNGSADYARDL